eukprot:5655118-Amphidinium_carterae.1
MAEGKGQGIIALSSVEADYSLDSAVAGHRFCHGNTNHRNLYRIATRTETCPTVLMLVRRIE